MAREFVAVIADGHATDDVWLQSFEGTILMLCLIFSSFSVLSFVLFVCADGSSSPKRRRGGDGGGGGCGGNGGGGDGGDGGCGCGGGGGGGCGGGGC